MPVSMEDFDKSFTGICLMIEPGESFVPGGKPKSVMKFVRNRLLTGQNPEWSVPFMAGLAEDIREMPMGMQTMISEGSGEFREVRSSGL